MSSSSIHRVHAFLTALQRRRVLRVVSLYGVAAWAFVEMATTVTEPLGLPPGTPRLVIILCLLGFPVAIILGWVFDLTAEGVERTDAVPGGERHWIRLPWLRPAMAVLLVAISVGAVAAIATRDELAPLPPPVIAVFPFDVSGDGELQYLGEGMVHLLRKRLDGAGDLRVIDPAALLNALGTTQARELRPSSAAAIARRLGANYFILGSLSAQGQDALTASALLYRTARPDATPAPVQVHGASALLPDLVDRLAASVMTGQLRTATSRDALRSGLTTSLPALRAFLSGEREYRASRWAEAAELFGRAVAEDSTFGLASYRLATAAEWLGDFQSVERAIAHAFRHRDDLHPHDRFLLDAFVAYQRGDADEAESLYRQLVSRYPEDGEAWYRLGEVLYHYNAVRGRPAAEARAAFERAAALQPEIQAFRLHLLDLALAERDYAAFDTLIGMLRPEEATSLRRTATRTIARGNAHEIERLMSELAVADAHVVYGVATSVAQHSRDLDNAARIANLLTAPTRNWLERAVGHLLLAQVETARGRRSAAVRQLAAVADSTGCTWRTVCEAYALAYGTAFLLLPVAGGSDAELREQRDRVLAWDAAAVPLFDMGGMYLGAHNGLHTVLQPYLNGLLSVHLGDATAAEEATRALEAGAVLNPDAAADAKHFVAGIRATLALVSGRADAAVRALDVRIAAPPDLIVNSPFRAHSHERLLRALALEEAGQHHEALRWYESLRSERSDIHLYGVSLWKSAEMMEALGRRAEAVALYREVIDTWEGADPEYRIVLETGRKRLRRLTGR